MALSDIIKKLKDTIDRDKELPGVQIVPGGIKGGVERVKTAFKTNPDQFNFFSPQNDNKLHTNIRPLDYLTDRLRHYVNNTYIDAIKDIPNAFSQIKQPGIENKALGVGRLGIDVLRAVPDPTDLAFAGYNFAKGALTSARKTGKPYSLENIKAGLESASGDKPTSLGSVVSDSGALKTTLDLAEIPATFFIAGRVNSKKIAKNIGDVPKTYEELPSLKPDVVKRLLDNGAKIEDIKRWVENGGERLVKEKPHLFNIDYNQSSVGDILKNKKFEVNPNIKNELDYNLDYLLSKTGLKKDFLKKKLKEGYTKDEIYRAYSYAKDSSSKIKNLEGYVDTTLKTNLFTQPKEAVESVGKNIKDTIKNTTENIGDQVKNTFENVAENVKQTKQSYGKVDELYDSFDTDRAYNLIKNKIINIKNEADAKEVEDKIINTTKTMLDLKIKSKGYSWEEFINLRENGNVPDELLKENQILDTLFNAMKDGAEQRLGFKAGKLENYWHRTTQDAINNWKPKTAGDILTPGYAKRRTGALKDYIKNPDVINHYFRESVGVYDDMQKGLVNVANKAKRFFENPNKYIKEEVGVGKEFSLTGELNKLFNKDLRKKYGIKYRNYGKPKSLNKVYWVDKLAGVDNTSKEFYKDFLWKMKQPDIFLNKKLAEIEQLGFTGKKRVEMINKALNDYYSLKANSINEFIFNAMTVEDKKLQKIVDKIFNEYVGGDIKVNSTIENVLNMVKNRIAVGALSLNPKSALNNIYELKRILALVNEKAFINGVKRARNENFIVKYGVDSQSNIAREELKKFQQLMNLVKEEDKTLADSLKIGVQKTDDALMKMFDMSERLKDNIMLAALEEQGKMKGLSGEVLEMFVRDKFDQYAIKFGKGQTIPFYKNPWFSTLAQFTQYGLKDNILLFNKIEEALRGDAGATSYLVKYGFVTLLQKLSDLLIFGSMYQRGNFGITAADQLSNMFGDAEFWYDRIPFVGPTGKFVLDSINLAFQNTTSGDEYTKDRLKNRIGNTAKLMIPAGNQVLNKTGDYLTNLKRGNYETYSGNVASPVGTSPLDIIRGTLFGKSYDSERRKYLDAYSKGENPALTRSQSEVYRSLPPDKAREYYNAVQEKRKESSEVSKARSSIRVKLSKDKKVDNSLLAKLVPSKDEKDIQLIQKKDYSSLSDKAFEKFYSNAKSFIEGYETNRQIIEADPNIDDVTRLEKLNEYDQKYQVYKQALEDMSQDKDRVFKAELKTYSSSHGNIKVKQRAEWAAEKIKSAKNDEERKALIQQMIDAGVLTTGSKGTIRYLKDVLGINIYSYGEYKKDGKTLGGSKSVRLKKVSGGQKIKLAVAKAPKQTSLPKVSLNVSKPKQSRATITQPVKIESPKISKAKLKLSKGYTPKKIKVKLAKVR